MSETSLRVLPADVGAWPLSADELVAGLAPGLDVFDEFEAAEDPRSQERNDAIAPGGVASPGTKVPSPIGHEMDRRKRENPLTEKRAGHAEGSWEEKEEQAAQLGSIGR